MVRVRVRARVRVGVTVRVMARFRLKRTDLGLRSGRIRKGDREGKV